jgi:hypothetical protein
MKIFELVNNISIQLTNEEVDLLGKFDNSSKIKKLDLNEREQVLANGLVNKDVLTRFKHEGKITFKKKIK